MTNDPLPSHCPECGVSWENGQTCKDDFHQMLYWENERGELGSVHHLLVLCYHLQHPSRYSKETFEEGKKMLRDFVEGGLSTQQVRRQNRERLSSTNRPWKITATSESHGTYDRPMKWTITARDVVAGGIDDYVENVNRWAKSILEQMKTQG